MPYVKTKPDGVSDRSWSIFLEVKANSERLAACPRPHDFVDDPADAGKPLFKRQVCTKCGGSVDGSSASWYRDGLTDGASG
jgi:hypothetical protein